MEEDEVQVPKVDRRESSHKPVRRAPRAPAQVAFSDPWIAQRNMYLLVVGVFALTAFLYWYSGTRVLVAELSKRSYDLIFQADERVRSWTRQPRETPRQVAIVGIDDESLERYGRWPWDRSRFADLVRGLKALGAKTVAMDIFFGEPQPSPLQGLGQIRASLPPGLDREEITAPLDGLSRMQRYLESVPVAAGEEGVANELRRRFVPPWEDEVFRREMARAGNVLLGTISVREDGAQEHAWFGPLRDNMPPDNAAETVLLADPELTVGDVRRLWEDDFFLYSYLDAVPQLRLPRVGRIGGREVSAILGAEAYAGYVAQRRWAPVIERYDTSRQELRAVGLVVPLAKLTAAAAGLGFMNDVSDADSVTRRVPLVNVIREHMLPSLSLAALGHFLDADTELVVDGDRDFEKFRFRRPEAPTPILSFDIGEDLDLYVNHYGVRTQWTRVSGRKEAVAREVSVIDSVPAYQILDAFVPRPGEDAATRAYRLEEQARLRQLLRSRLVFVGATAFGLIDIRSTPYGRKRPGIETHAAIAANILEGSILRRRGSVEVLLQLGATLGLLVLLAFVLPRVRPVTAFLIFLLVLFGANFWCWVCFRFGSVLIPFEISLPLMLYFAIGLAYLNLVENKEKAWLDGMFKRYVSPEYVEQIKANKGKLDLHGRETIITPFFSDMAKFSTISEAFSAEGLFRFLGEYLGEMADILDEYGGTLDKFEGDAVVAFFGAPIPYDDHAAKACLASLAMQRRILELEAEWREGDRYPELHALAKKVGGWFPIRVRIGLNTGPCATGHLGTAERGNYTMMGDTVNLAARLEAAGKQYGIRLTVSEDTFRAAKDAVVGRPVDMIQVVGRTSGTMIYEVMAERGRLERVDKAFLVEYEEGWSFYRDRAFSKAKAAYLRAQALRPDDRVTEMFLGRCDEFIQRPPPEDWDGVHVLTEK